MSEQEATHGLSCPRCGGMIPIPEGQRIVQCPYCDLRSMVKGERGIQRYQVARRINRDQALSALRGFLKSHGAIAMDAANKALLAEAMVVYLPFWSHWTRALGWILGQKRVRSGKNTTYKAREVKVAVDLNWNGAACDVGEFGVEAIPLTNQSMDPFDPDALHESGLVFEPTNSESDARQSAASDFDQRLRKLSKLDRISQVFVRFINQRMGLVYYPLWVVRYLYRGRSFQVAVDGFSGQVLYGKAPGNTIYRAGVLVGGMALGAFLAVDVSSLALFLISQVDEGDAIGVLLMVAGGAFLFGLGLMGAAYRAFRFGEQYEYRAAGKKASAPLFKTEDILSKFEEVGKWLDE
ncbi:MAG: hypothetical protein JW726_08375 [Anaerolineales bacterium]|nr:hypothetical protein [Anaerolineales bacterium]